MSPTQLGLFPTFAFSSILIQLWKCDELLFVLKKLDAYPTCLAAQQARGNLAQVQVPIHASNREGGIHKASARRVNAGMTIWVALVIHMIGSEIYVSINGGSESYPQPLLGVPLCPNMPL